MIFNAVKLQKILTTALLIFTLVSIGFLFGKHSASDGIDNGAPAAGTYVAVYYLHATFRCVSCNAIEALTKGLLDTSYAEPLANGSIRWSVVDFQENEALAKKFRVVATSVVVALVDNGRIRDFERLDKIWTFAEKPEELTAYIQAAIDRHVAQLPAGAL
ncbi:nitrophenyl compound nitroreductase subunit ArsF family protein [Chrysiogenes arsenatis]|uniref:nitrophenyl compound nitroreductase subunit ArsF family protein n=1 Tax=Chrysiogenes arsenatis TaxID=309797 RepID=UPI000417B158|nr:nitrophenyl compound nitroreductase subunit ArsF family protein [Chrysiogenes arsenatis]